MSDLDPIAPAEEPEPPRRRRKKDTAAEVLKAAAEMFEGKIEKQAEPVPDVDHSEELEKLSDIDRMFLTGESPRYGGF
jgi:hypothetical protein